MRIYSSFQKHFSVANQNKDKASEYERIMAQKDELIDAVQAVKAESISVKSELSEMEQYVARIERENQTMRSLLALLCKCRADGDYIRVEEVLVMISNQYIDAN